MTAMPAALLLTGLLFDQPAPPPCETWQSCRDEAQSAAAQGEHEAFHDLAWRAMQLRRGTEPDLMYLLARAQSLSGRPHDALVMLRRLTDMGVPPGDAATSEDFRRVRALAGWPDLHARIEAAVRETADGRSPGRPVGPADPSEGTTAAADAARAPEAAAGRAGSPAAPAMAAAGPGIEAPAAAPARVLSSEVARFPASPFTPGGLAYDSASRRLVIGNLPERKLTVVGDGLNRSTTLAGAAAGFLGPVAALDIDRARGDLWVISGGSPGNGGDLGGSALHKLQLISGRVLGVFTPAGSLGRARLTDLAVTAGGEPAVLDAEGPRLLRVSPGTQELGRPMELPAGEVTSLSAGPRRQIAFVAYADRLVRVDLAARRARTMGHPPEVPLAGLERIRWHEGTLVGVQRGADGLRRLVQLRLSRDHTRVLALSVLDSSLPADAGPIDLAVFKEELYYLISPGEGREAVVRRLPLR